MIKDVMVWLDGSLSDEVRLTAAAEIPRRFESQPPWFCHRVVFVPNEAAFGDLALQRTEHVGFDPGHSGRRPGGSFGCFWISASVLITYYL